MFSDEFVLPPGEQTSKVGEFDGVKLEGPEVPKKTGKSRERELEETESSLLSLLSQPDESSEEEGESSLWGLGGEE